MTIEEKIFAYELFDKRDKFPFFIACMPYLLSDIPSSIFYDSIFSEFLQIARSTLRLTDFVPKASQLYTRMKTQGGNKASILCQIKKAFQRYISQVLKDIRRNNQINIYVLTSKLQLF